MAKKKTTKSARSGASSSRSKKKSTTKTRTSGAGKKTTSGKKATKKKAAKKTAKKAAKKKTAKKTTKKTTASKRSSSKSASSKKSGGSTGSSSSKQSSRKTSSKSTKRTTSKNNTAKTKPGSNKPGSNKPKPGSRGTPAPAAATGTTLSTNKKPRRKTHLSQKELTYYKKLLLLKRAELLGDLDSMSEEALHSESTDLSHMPIHMADVGSDTHGKELMLGLLESERRLLQEIDEAIRRIADRTYGVCEATGQPIDKNRLNAKPWAKYCIEAARQMERNQH